MDDLAFLGKLFPSTPLSQVWVGWNDGSGGFPGGPADRYLSRLPAWAGHYFCIGSLKAGHVTRKIADIGLIHCLVLDDIGTKTGWELVPSVLDKLNKPTWIIETSSGNFQYGWTYEKPVEPEDWLRHRHLVMECVRRWGCDKAGADPNRLVRLPSGYNLKPGRGDFAVRFASTPTGVSLPTAEEHHAATL